MSVEPEAQPVEPTEMGDEPSKLAGGCVVLALVGVAGAVAYAVPETGYYVAGLLTAAGARKARTWTGRHRAAADTEEPEPEPEPVDVAEQLRALSGGEQHVLLTRLATAASLTTNTGRPDTRVVRALLDDAGIRVRGVRGLKPDGKQGNGPGVHVNDIPAASSPKSGAPSERCLCSSGANANTNNDGEQGPEKGFRVELIGQAGTVVHDPAEAQRHQKVRAQ